MCKVGFLAPPALLKAGVPFRDLIEWYRSFWGSRDTWLFTLNRHTKLCKICDFLDFATLGINFTYTATRISWQPWPNHSRCCEPAALQVVQTIIGLIFWCSKNEKNLNFHFFRGRVPFLMAWSFDDDLGHFSHPHEPKNTARQRFLCGLTMVRKPYFYELLLQ